MVSSSHFGADARDRQMPARSHCQHVAALGNTSGVFRKCSGIARPASCASASVFARPRSGRASTLTPRWSPPACLRSETPPWGGGVASRWVAVWRWGSILVDHELRGTKGVVTDIAHVIEACPSKSTGEQGMIERTCPTNHEAGRPLFMEPATPQGIGSTSAGTSILAVQKPFSCVFLRLDISLVRVPWARSAVVDPVRPGVPERRLRGCLGRGQPRPSCVVRTAHPWPLTQLGCAAVPPPG